MGTPIWRAMGDRSCDERRDVLHLDAVEPQVDPRGLAARVRVEQHLARAGGDEREDPLAVELARHDVRRAEGHAVDRLRHLDRGDEPAVHLEGVAPGAAPREPRDVARPRVLDLRIGRACASSSSAACSMSPENQ